MRGFSSGANGTTPVARRWAKDLILSVPFAGLVGALVAGGSACMPGAYTCSSSEECVSSSGLQGTCDTTGFCADPDTTCTTSFERYADSAGNGLASGCVPAATDACVQQLAVGQDFACVVETDGSVWCWGNNSNGQTGDPSTVGGVDSLPVKVPLPEKAYEVQVAEYHSCALLVDGTVYCWGFNDQTNLGQCESYGTGPGQLHQSVTPLKMFYATVTPSAKQGEQATWYCDPSKPLKLAIPSPSNQYVNTLSVGGEHTCAIDINGKLLCWGENTTTPVGGQAGQDWTLYPSVEGPLEVTGSDSATFMQDQIVDVQAGDDYTCLLTNQGYVYCWGGNQDGELADNQKVAWSDSPALIPLATSVDSLQVDDETACAVSMGTINCWGNGSSGIFYQSTGNNDNANSPVVLGAASALFGGSNAETFCFQTPAAQVQCWGSNSSGQAAIGSLSPINVDAPKTALIPPVTQLGIGQDHGCALTKAGQVFCWGGNMLGELGNGKTSMTPNPVPAPVKLTCASGS